MACGNNMISRTMLQSVPTTLGHPSVAQARNPTRNVEQAAYSVKQVSERVSRAEDTIRTASTVASVKTALREAETALSTARRAGGGREAKNELRRLERKVYDLRRTASKKQADVSQDDRRTQVLIAHDAFGQVDHLAPMGLGVIPGNRLPEADATATAGDTGITHVEEDIALQGLARSLPAYSEQVDRRDSGWHLAREDFDPERDLIPSHAQLGLRQRVVSVARTDDGDIAFLNQDGLPVAARVFLAPEQSTPRDAWMQSQMQKVFKDTGLHAGHMGPVSQGGPHLIEFVTGQIPGFNMGAQGGFENATKKAPAGTVSIEVSVVVDVALGVSVPRGYWFESVAIAADGTRSPISEATGYFQQRD